MSPGTTPPEPHDLRSLLKSRGLRATSHRQSVLKVLFDAPSPVRASVLLSQVSSLDRATLYRTLNRMVEAELVQVVVGARGVRRFLAVPQGAAAPRIIAQFECTECGRQRCFPQPSLELSLGSSQWAPAISGARVQVTLSGACPDCLAVEGAA